MAYDPDAPSTPPEPDGRNSSASRTVSMIGKTIAGNFRITSLIGAGAMGDVYQAQQLSLGKDVALKLLRRELLIDETLRRRFELEAKNASTLNHPNCIQIIDFGRDSDLLFIAMEYLKGSDLSHTIERDWPFPLERTIHIFDQVLAALEEAHEHGIVHRDLKPANVMLVSRRGDPDFVKVCDFGIAKAEGIQSSWAEGLTMKGLICGTPEYMSPEQARGEKLDGRSDLYAAGIVLYQMLTREVPFKSSSPVALLSMHLGEPPMPPSVRTPGLDIPQRLEDLVLRALEKDPALRPHTASEFRSELREAVSEVLAYVPALGTGPRSSGVRTTATRPGGSSGSTLAAAAPTTETTVAAPLFRGKRWPLWLGGAAVLVAGAAVVVPALQSQTAPSQARQSVAPQAPVPGAGVHSLPEESGAALPAPAPSVEAEASRGAATHPGESPSPHPAAKKRTKPSAIPAAAARGASPSATSEASPPVPGPSLHAAPTPHAPTAALHAPVAAQAGAGAQGPLQEGQQLLGKGLYQQACQKGEEARKLDASQPAVYKFLGKCYMRAGDTTRANDNYRRYIELAPSASDADFIRSIVK